MRFVKYISSKLKKTRRKKNKIWKDQNTLHNVILTNNIRLKKFKQNRGGWCDVWRWQEKKLKNAYWNISNKTHI